VNGHSIDEKKWIVLVLNPRVIGAVQWAIGPFENGEHAYAYLEDMDFNDSVIITLTPVPEEYALVPADAGP